jgi:hypothetical protein
VHIWQTASLHNEELLNLYSAQNVIKIIKEDGMGRACCTNRRDEKYIPDFGSKPGKEEIT